MAQFTDVLKDIYSLWTRLFDHRVFLVGEIQFTIQEFEQTPDDTEIEQLFNVLKNIDDITVSKMDDLKKNINETYSESCTYIKEALSICNDIEDFEQCNLPVEKPTSSKEELEWNNLVKNLNTYLDSMQNFSPETETEIYKTFLM